MAKKACGINTSNLDMSDEEIRTVCKWLAEKAPDTIWADNEPIFGRMGFDVMLSITLYEFPDFYERYGLTQVN